MAADVSTSPTTALNLIGGEWKHASDGASYEILNPARPSEVVARAPLATEADVAAAVEAAAVAFPTWAATPSSRRAEILSAAADIWWSQAAAISSSMAREMGKPVREARGEVGRVGAILRYFAGEAFRSSGELFEQATGGRIVTTRRPLGVVGLITPWNFPAAIPAWKAAPAVAFGNTVVLKASCEAPTTALKLGECLTAAGVPAGVLNIVIGSGAIAGAALVKNDRIDAISFTGSVATGQAIRNSATTAGKRVQCELGGQNPLLVLADADLDRAADAAVAGAFWSAGQKCTATRRIYIEASVYGSFSERLLRRTAALRIGDPIDPATEVGPLVNETQFNGVLEAIDHGIAEGGQLIAGGGRHGDTGWFVEPTVFANVADDASLSREEVFGPVVSLYSFNTLTEAIERANDVSMGLSASIFTSNLTAVERFDRELNAGILHVNSQTAGAEVHVPFGGIKNSGWGPHEQGRTARDFYTDVVTIYYDT